MNQEDGGKKSIRSKKMVKNKNANKEILQNMKAEKPVRKDRDKKEEKGRQ